eukprot:282769_1
MLIHHHHKGNIMDKISKIQKHINTISDQTKPTPTNPKINLIQANGYQEPIMQIKHQEIKKLNIKQAEANLDPEENDLGKKNEDNQNDTYDVDIIGDKKNEPSKKKRKTSMNIGNDLANIAG